MAFFKKLRKKEATPNHSNLLPQNTILQVQTSLQKVLQTTKTISPIFYAQLFEIDPSTRPLFSTENDQQLKQQETKFALMLSAIVNSLTNLDSLIPVLQDLGKKHLNYKVQKSHYETFGIALLSTFALILADDFTQETKKAWEDTYGLITSIITESSY